jgi:hypothetical protein
MRTLVHFVPKDYPHADGHSDAIFDLFTSRAAAGQIFGNQCYLEGMLFVTLAVQIKENVLGHCQIAMRFEACRDLVVNTGHDKLGTNADGAHSDTLVHFA